MGVNEALMSSRTVHVRAISPQVYRNECGKIVKSLNHSISIVGVGKPTINCEGKGRFISLAFQTSLESFSNSSLTLASLNIVNAQANTSGGAVRVVGGNLRVLGCQFNHATSLGSGGDQTHGGGALYVEAGALEVAGCGFTHCAASGSGGAILLVDSSPSRLHDTIWFNTCGLPQLNISNSKFDFCAAGVAGGAVALVNFKESVDAAVILTESTFSQCITKSETKTNLVGGGLFMSYMQGATKSNHEYTKCSFMNNIVSSPGGAFGGGIYITYWLQVQGSALLVNE